MIGVPDQHGAGQVNGVESAMSEELSEPTGRHVVVLADRVLRAAISEETW